MIKMGGISKDNIRDILKSKNDNICLDYDFHCLRYKYNFIFFKIF